MLEQLFIVYQFMRSSRWRQNSPTIFADRFSSFEGFAIAAG
jgi:hypothetical protein